MKAKAKPTVEATFQRPRRFTLVAREIDGEEEFDPKPADLARFGLVQSVVAPGRFSNWLSEEFGANPNRGLLSVLRYASECSSLYDWMPKPEGDDGDDDAERYRRFGAVMRWMGRVGDGADAAGDAAIMAAIVARDQEVATEASR